MLERLIQQIGDLAIFAAVAMVFGIIKTIMRPSQRSFKNYMMVVFVSVPVGMLSGGLALEWGAGDYLALALASVGSLAAEGIINAVLDNKEVLSRALNNLVDKYTK